MRPTNTAATCALFFDPSPMSSPGRPNGAHEGLRRPDVARVTDVAGVAPAEPERIGVGQSGQAARSSSTWLLNSLGIDLTHSA